MPLLVPPVEQAQFSARRAIEVAESAGTQSLIDHLSLPNIETETTALADIDVPKASTEGSSTALTEILAPISKWSLSLEHKFAHLAARIATETASAQEKKDFSALQSERRRLHLARPGTAVLHDFEERKRTAELVEALKRYVEFASH